MSDIKNYYKNIAQLTEKRQDLEKAKKERDVIRLLLKELNKKIDEIETELTKEEEGFDL